jgi:hypothetical protein
VLTADVLSETYHMHLVTVGGGAVAGFYPSAAARSPDHRERT